MIELRDLTVKFGGVTALDHLTVQFRQPVSGIIGPNGAGKTTTMNAISGFLDCQGDIYWHQEKISHLAAQKRTRWGLRRSFQREQIADDLSVRDNLLALLDNIPVSRAEKQQSLVEALEITGLTAKADIQARQLNTFERRLTDIARCLVGKPRLVMFDEPCGGLPQDETRHLGDLIVRVSEHTGATVLVIDHDVDLIARICSETLVLDFGKRIAFGETRAVLENPKVQAAYLGIEEV